MMCPEQRLWNLLIDVRDALSEAARVCERLHPGRARIFDESASYLYDTRWKTTQHRFHATMEILNETIAILVQAKDKYPWIQLRTRLEEEWTSFYEGE